MSGFMNQFHASFAWFVIVLNGLVGVWALLSIRFEQLDQPALWWSVITAEVGIVVQVLSGIWLRSVDSIGVSNFHVFYGVVAIIFSAIAYLYARGSDWVQDHRQVFYGLFSLFLMGVGIRAVLQAG